MRQHCVTHGYRDDAEFRSGPQGPVHSIPPPGHFAQTGAPTHLPPLEPGIHLALPFPYLQMWSVLDEISRPKRPIGAGINVYEYFEEEPPHVKLLAELLELGKRLSLEDLEQTVHQLRSFLEGDLYGP